MAATKLKKHHCWRTQRGVDFLLEWKPPEALKKYFPGGFAGFDSAGSPVWIIPLGKIDMKGILACVGREEFIDFILSIMETSMMMMNQKVEESFSPLNLQHVFLLDMAGFSLKVLVQLTQCPSIHFTHSH